jgi:light-regulated signal transduction histidine kinase (bacteriophytochrome)
LIPGYELELADKSKKIDSLNKDLDAFLYSVSHDLRAPLRTIDGFSLLLLEDYGDKLDDEGKSFLQKVRNGAQKMAGLIEGMLQISRLSRHPLEIKTINLTELANKIVKELQKASPERDINISIAENLCLEADRDLIQKALTHLLSNAWKFTANTDKAVIEMGSNSEQAFFIKDNGVGFDMKYAKKLFNPFQRLHGAEYEGSGIGLAMTKKILERHHGKIWVEAEPKEGACFYFSL